MGKLARFLGFGDGRRDLVDDLALSYRAEMEQAALLRAQAERARYPQMAAEAFVERPVVAGKNNWERLVAARHAAQRKRQRMVEQVAHWDPDEPAAVALLGRIEQEDVAAIPAYDALIMRSDPQALD